jgi:hypothetical protein
MQTLFASMVKSLGRLDEQVNKLVDSFTTLAKGNVWDVNRGFLGGGGGGGFGGGGAGGLRCCYSRCCVLLAGLLEWLAVRL